MSRNQGLDVLVDPIVEEFGDSGGWGMHILHTGRISCLEKSLDEADPVAKKRGLGDERLETVLVNLGDEVAVDTMADVVLTEDRRLALTGDGINNWQDECIERLDAELAEAKIKKAEHNGGRNGKAKKNGNGSTQATASA